jgi:hypothetical protein
MIKKQSNSKTKHSTLLLLRIFFGIIFVLVVMSYVICPSNLAGGGHNSPAAGISIIVYIVLPFVSIVAVGLVSLGSFVQFILRKQPVYFTILTDIGLFVVIARNIIVSLAGKCPN